MTHAHGGRPFPIEAVLGIVNLAVADQDHADLLLARPLIEYVLDREAPAGRLAADAAVCGQLLAGQHPWLVAPDGDRDELQRWMLQILLDHPGPVEVVRPLDLPQEP